MLRLKTRGRRGRDRMVVGFTTTYAISAYHHQSCEFESRSMRGVLDTILTIRIMVFKATFTIFKLYPGGQFY
jgi:hypothetical protein